jgi:RNA polymerase sigma-70 factor (ECF subfamily)
MFLRRPSITPLSDEALIAHLAKGDGPLLGVLWDRYAHLLFGVAMKYLKDVEAAKDLVMGLFEELPGLLAKQEVIAFRPWVHAVMRNCCLMALRKAEPGKMPEERLAAEEDGDHLLKEASLQALEAAIKALPEGQQVCIQQFYLERNSYRQVAQRTGMPVEQVRSHLQNGRRNLRHILTGHGTKQ